jgi:hypothetical protein
MSLGFLVDYGARRTRGEGETPILLTDNISAAANEDEICDFDYEVPAGSSEPLPIGPATQIMNWPLRPVRFIDGKDVGRTVAWLQAEEGYPVAVRLSQIGAVVLRDPGDGLRREAHIVEKVVSMVADPFPWYEVEGFGIALQEHGLRLLIAVPPEGTCSFDFEPMRRAANGRTTDEMVRLERDMLARAPTTPTIVDGRLETRAGAFDPAVHPVTGVVKTHFRSYLHARGWQVFYRLQPGERTPAFALAGPKLRVSVVTWYVRLCGARGELPNSGVVRIEVAQEFFEGARGWDWSYLDQLSRLVCDYRSRDETYGRAAVSMKPIQRAEESLASCFGDSEHFNSRFYRLTGL